MARHLAVDHPFANGGGREMEEQPLKTELELFESKRADFLRGSAGKYVLIHGNEIIGFFDRKRDALNEGYRKFKREPFLVKLISDTPRRVYFTSNVSLCGSCR